MHITFFLYLIIKRHLYDSRNNNKLSFIQSCDKCKWESKARGEC